jgi:hypothetical protein
VALRLVARALGVYLRSIGHEGPAERIEHQAERLAEAVSV